MWGSVRKFSTHRERQNNLRYSKLEIVTDKYIKQINSIYNMSYAKFDFYRANLFFWLRYLLSKRFPKIKGNESTFRCLGIPLIENF